ncbi:MAG TPA: DMT family transporter [Candidatus Limnocylindrales bacterium]
MTQSAGRSRPPPAQSPRAAFRSSSQPPEPLSDATFRSSFAPRDLGALILAAASWGLGTVMSKRALEEIPSLTLLPIQLAASLMVLLALMRFRGIALRGGDAPPLLGRLGILNPGLAYALGLLGLVSISASLSVMIWALEPLMILVFAVVFLRERIGPALVAVSVVAVAGMVLVLYDPASSGQLPGVLLSLAGVGCCAAYTIIARRWIAASDSTAQVVASQQAYALAFALVVLIATSLFLGGIQVPAVTPIGWVSAVASGVLYYAAAYWLYLTALRRVPASLAAVSFYLIPVFGVAGGLTLLDEQFETRQWIGVIVVLIAVLSAYLGRATTTVVAQAQSRAH